LKSPIDLDQRLQAILDSPAYRLAYQDSDLLSEDDLRPVRLHLELLKPERILREQEVHSTVVVFGSARVQDRSTAMARLAGLEGKTPGNATDEASLKMAQRRVEQSAHYEEARRFAAQVSLRFQQVQRCDFVVVTGGGPGIMEAANRGAYDVGARSIGLNITLPHEQLPNPYTTPELAFHFHYFAIRKIHFLLHARGLVVFPGGYGTMDELFEVLTLIQTGKMPAIPVVLVGEDFWKKVINFDHLVDEGYISPEDRALFTCVNTAEEIMAALDTFYAGRTPRSPAECDHFI